MGAGRIRRALLSDAPALARLHVAAWRAGYAHILPRSFLERVTESAREAHFRLALESGREDIAVFDDDGAMQGFVTVGRCRDEDAAAATGEIWGIYVDPRCWRRGIGSRLVAWGLGELENHGCALVTLWVLEENLVARQFYESAGFRADGKMKLIDLDFPLRALRYARGVSSCTS